MNPTVNKLEPYNKRIDDKALKVLAKKIDENAAEISEINVEVKNVNSALALNVEHIDNVIGSMKEDISKIKETQREMREDVNPILELQHDIAAVGRLGSWIKTIITWFVVVGGALLAFWEWAKHLGELK
jgi:chromosome segregation ATPase